MRDLFDFAPKKQLYAVFGNPISHSQSPLVHRLFGKQMGIDLEYRAVQVDIGGFEQAVSGFQANGGNGLNVTVPFKVNAWKLVDELTDRARLAGAVNTLTIGDDLKGDNTDGAGLVKDIESNLGFPFEGTSVLIIGAGGAVRGILPPILARKPESIIIANRTKSRADALVNAFAGLGNVEAVAPDAAQSSAYDIIINATSTGIRGDLPAISPRTFHDVKLVYDLVYAKRPTRFMDWAEKNGVEKIHDGLGMLVEQAAESFRIWHGVSPQTAQVIKTVREQL